MPDFVRRLKMPAGFDAVPLYPYVVRCPAWACLVASLSIRYKCLVCGRNALTSVVLKDIRPFNPVLEHTIKNNRRNVREGAEHPGRLRVAGSAMCGQQGTDWSGRRATSRGLND